MGVSAIRRVRHLSPAYLRPRLTETETTMTVLLKHFGAFAVIGFLFSVAYSRTTLVCVLVLGSAVILELLQLVVPDRDARVIDAVEKLIGGGIGIISARIFCRLILENSAPEEPAPVWKRRQVSVLHQAPRYRVRKQTGAGAARTSIPTHLPDTKRAGLLAPRPNWIGSTARVTLVSSYLDRSPG